MIHVVPGVLLRHPPAGTPLPLVFDVSRSGREYPPDFRSPAPFTEVHDNVSMYLDELYSGAPAAGATLLYACFPNMYIDVNRGPLDIDADLIHGKWPVPLQPTQKSEIGLGLLKRSTRSGIPMHEAKLPVAEVQERLRRYYDPYHRELGDTIQGLRRQFGAAWQLSCHCMSSVGAKVSAEPGKPRPDFCIGDLDGMTCAPEFTEFLVETIRGYGYSITVNDPYRGGELIRRHSDPKNGVHSAQIEISKRLFMDVATFKKNEGFDRLKADLDRLILAVADHIREKLRRTE